MEDLQGVLWKLGLYLLIHWQSLRARFKEIISMQSWPVAKCNFFPHQMPLNIIVPSLKN